MEMREGGTYAVALNTPSSAYLATDIPFTSGLLYYIDDSGGSPQRQLVSSIFIKAWEASDDVVFGWPAAGQYELDIIQTGPPCCLNLKGDPLHFFAKLFFGDVAYAQFDPPIVVETLRFTIQEESASFTPVIVIPGILGSAQHNGKWLIDPITHIYDNLIETLAANGYEKGVTLFPFPYDWHLSNAITATLLKNKITDVKAICGCDKVDIVAHSMGGLVARAYIQSAEYRHDVRKLIFLGTPQMGAPNAYLMWEGGEAGVEFLDKILREILIVEARKNGYPTLFDYERNLPIPSVQELLPVYGYIKHVGSDDIPSFPNSQWYPGNLFLYNLDLHIADLYGSGVALSNFVGQTTDNTTIEMIRVTPPATPDPDILWGFGKPERFDESSEDQGLERGAGDGTVPLSSASLVISDLSIVNSEHNDLPTKTEGDVFKELTGRDAAILITKTPGVPEILKNVLIFQVLSPVDILIEAPDRKKIGKNFQTDEEMNEIPGAFYSGFGGDDEFITIPNPLDGKYKIFTQGTGSGGLYTLVAGVITDATSSTSFFSGSTLPGLVTEHEAEIDKAAPSDMKILPADQMSPTITFSQPATSTYPHSSPLPISATFSDYTGVASSSVLFDARSIDASTTVDLFFEKLGAHTITAFATDLVNNSASSTRTVQVIATVESTKSDLDRAYSLGWLTKSLKDHLMYELGSVIAIRKITSKTKTGTMTTVTRYVDKLLLQAMLLELQAAKARKQINPQGYQLLVDDINWLLAR
jgi:pimeloyl-ACP methyl ester carboxylesterase